MRNVLLHQATYADFMLWCASHTASRRLLKQLKQTV